MALIATGSGAVTEGRGFLFTEGVSIVGAYASAKLQGNDVVPVIAGAAVGTAIGEGGGKTIEILNKYFPIASEEAAGIAGAIGGSVVSEATGSQVEDKLKVGGNNK